MGFAEKRISGHETQWSTKKIRSGPYLSDYCGATDSPRPASRSPARPCPGTAFVDAARWAGPSGIAAMSAGRACLASARTRGQRPNRAEGLGRAGFKLTGILRSIKSSPKEHTNIKQ
jgi:hypothetical protein